MIREKIGLERARQPGGAASADPLADKESVKSLAMLG